METWGPSPRGLCWGPGTRLGGHCEKMCTHGHSVRLRGPCCQGGQGTEGQEGCGPEENAE